MTYPGMAGQIGPPPVTPAGQQVRQSRVGSAGNSRYPSVINSMGANAPATAVAAAAITVLQQILEDPYPIEGGD